MEDNVTAKFAMVPLSEIKPYKKNPRRNDGAVDKVAESIKRFGPLQPIAVDEDNIILAGHTRHKAALKLGLKIFPCIIKEGLTEEQKKAYRLADNKTHELASWDFDLLRGELDEIKGIDMRELGFDGGGGELLGPDSDKSKGSRIREIFEVIVVCEDEDTLQHTYNKLTKDGYKCRISTF